MAFDFCTQRPLTCETDSITVCGEGIDGVIRTVRTDVNNVLGNLPSASVQSQIGRSFISGFFAIFDTDAGVNEVAIIIENPGDSGRIMYINKVFGGTAATDPVAPDERLSISLSFRKDPTPGADILSITNLNFGSGETSMMEATFTLGSPGGNTFALTSEEVGVSFKYDFVGEIIVPPGHSFGIRFLPVGRALDLTDIPLWVNVTWNELDL